MRRPRVVAMVALVTLFFAEGQRAFFASLFGLAYDALFPTFRVGPALLALLPLAALLAPLVPLARWTDRRGAVAVAAAGAALARLVMVSPSAAPRLVGGAFVLAFTGMFLVAAVGELDRRAVAAGAVTGLVADQLLRLAGSSYDLSLQPGWLPVQLALSGVLLALVIARMRSGGDREDDGGLERRSGGLRLRAALPLGALLFMDLHVLGLPPVVARWADVPYGGAALATAAAGAVALFAATTLPRPTLGRIPALSLSALVAVGAIVGHGGGGAPVAGLMAVAHLAALLLVTRTLDPASGRRSGATASAGLGVFVLGTALYALTFYSAFTLPFMTGAGPWIFLGAGLVLCGSFLLLPRPEALPRPESFVPGLGAAGAVIAIAIALVALGPASEPTPEAAPAAAGVGTGVTAEGTGVTAEGAGDHADASAVTVVTWNVHYGFDERWVFDPGRMADVLARSDADIVALQEVLVGAPTAYGIDLPRWLAGRLGFDHHFSPTVDRLLGDAFLTRRPPARVDAVPLPAGGGDRKQLLRLVTSIGGQSVAFHALHLGVDPRVRPPQMAAALDAAWPGPAVVLGDLNTEGGSVPSLLQGAGFRDAFDGVGSPRPTFPARDPTARIDWIWIRGLQARSATVLDATPSDHRAVRATLHVSDTRTGSSY